MIKIDLTFLKSEWRFLFFALMMAMCSGPGQTFFISFFHKTVTTNLNISLSTLSLVYMMATLSSACLLIPTGRVMDRAPLNDFSKWVILGMVGACIFYPFVDNIFMLFIGFLLLRFFGQGLMSLTASTAVARRYDKERGRALAFVNIGFSLAEAAFPPFVVLTILYLGWQNIWFFFAAFIFICMFLPLKFFLSRTKGQDGEGVSSQLPDEKPASNIGNNDSDWKIYDLFKNRYFYLILPLTFIPSAIITAILFMQEFIADAKGWSLILWASSFIFYSLASIIGNIMSGLLIDKFSARYIAFFNLLPLTIGLLLLAFMSSPYAIFFVMMGMGLSGGTNGTVLSALWAEIYGRENLGQIKSFAMFLMVAGSAVGPILYSIGFDNFIPLSFILSLSALFSMAGCLMAWFVRY